MKHTLETLLPLLDTPAGLEKLRIITAEADGWRMTGNITRNGSNIYERGYTKAAVSHCPLDGLEWLPNYPASLDAIFAAEERLGLHDSDAHSLFVTWTGFCSEFARLQPKRIWHCTFLTAAQRCIPFILTSQEVRPS